jgi:hypothetical protein
LLTFCISIYFLYNGEKLLNNNLAITALTYKMENDENTIRSNFYSTALVQGTIGSFGFGRGLGASTKIIEGSSYHQYLLEILAEFGLWIFLVYLTLIAKICIQLWRAIQKRRNIFWSGGLLASCIAFPILCTGPASLIYVYPYWLWLAFLVAFTDYDSGAMSINKSTLSHRLNFGK